MGLVIDSSVVIASERRGENVAQLLRRIAESFSDQRSVLSAIGLTELVHGIYRAQTPAVRSRREAFIKELISQVEIYPYSSTTAHLAGKIDGEQQNRAGSSSLLSI
jgi:predicted nucleic acid-binding protein